jgi:hypothetical protein
MPTKYDFESEDDREKKRQKEAQEAAQRAAERRTQEEARKAEQRRMFEQVDATVQDVLQDYAASVGQPNAKLTVKEGAEWNLELRTYPIHVQATSEGLRLDNTQQ